MMMEKQALVIKNTGSIYSVMDKEKNVYDCKLRGNLRLKGLRFTNPVAIGDFVMIQKDEQEDYGVISRILERKNYVVRRATKLTSSTQIIAANLDRVMLILTIKHPRIAIGFIDRYLVTCEAYHIPVVLVFNKTDIYGEKETKKLNELIDIYSGIGYECHAISATEKIGIKELKQKLCNQTTLVSGQSGVGKSTLINAIEPDIHLKTGSISDYHNKGKHVTTFAQMYPLSFGGFIIDTPGIREFGLIDFNKNEVWERFPEMRAIHHQCKYHNCIHLNEPDCAVIRAVENRKISESRYVSYLNILEDEMKQYE